MRLIDADALVEELMYAEMGEVHKFCFPCKEILQKIDAQPTIESPHWTPCSEKLPLTYEGDIPVAETYIVTVSVDGVLFVDKAYSFGTYIDGFWDTVNDWDEGNDVHVLAWMPLPEAYTGGGDA
jgi:hypothetical protein